jgi:hypothetical protein
VPLISYRSFQYQKLFHCCKVGSAAGPEIRHLRPRAGPQPRPDLDVTLYLDSALLTFVRLDVDRHRRTFGRCGDSPRIPSTPFICTYQVLTAIGTFYHTLFGLLTFAGPVTLTPFRPFLWLVLRDDAHDRVYHSTTALTFPFLDHRAPSREA